MLKGRVRRDIQGDITGSELSTCKVMAMLARIPAAAVAGESFFPVFVLSADAPPCAEGGAEISE